MVIPNTSRWFRRPLVIWVFVLQLFDNKIRVLKRTPHRHLSVSVCPPGSMAKMRFRISNSVQALIDLKQTLFYRIKDDNVFKDRFVDFPDNLFTLQIKQKKK